ncbi:hypothetical protein PFISCL1PPCAC_755, partial [Pristionchus fissidentatus]
KEVEGPATPAGMEEKKEIVIPPAPDLPVDPEVEGKFKQMFEMKAMGLNVNKRIQNMKDFLNPSIYELFIEQHELKEFGSNFPLEQYNPDGYPEECYYDYIEGAQKAAGDAPAAKKPKMKVVRQVRQQCVGAFRASSSTASAEKATKSERPVTRAQVEAACAPKVFKYTDQLSRHLEQSLILHEPGRFVILQKPYGVPCLGFKQKDGGIFKNSVHNSLDKEESAENEEKYESLDRTVTVADCIPHLSKILRESQLGFCAGLKRYVSGPLILPCGRPDYDKMRASVRSAGSMSARDERDTHAFYQHAALAIVVGRPQEVEGTVAGFATFQPVGDHKEYVFVEGTSASRRQKTGKYAVQGEVTWTTLASGHDCSLLHLQFGKFARHLPRLALSHIDCPILGDDVYSQRFFDVDGKAVRMEPARAARNKGKKFVPSRLLSRLGSDAPPIERLPMYFHVWQTVLPKYGGSADLVASAPPPPHFDAMVDLLGFTKQLKKFWTETSQ